MRIAEIPAGTSYSWTISHGICIVSSLRTSIIASVRFVCATTCPCRTRSSILRLPKTPKGESSFLQLENFGLVPNPQSAPTHFNTANVLFKLKRYEEALASYDRALAIRPDFAEAHHGRGTVLRTFGRIEEARPLLEKAVELAPRRVEFVNTLAESKRFVESEADDLCAGGRTTDDQEGRAAPARKGAASEIMPDKLEP
jgi:tetratricopeptide (TPR) repeat protein